MSHSSQRHKRARCARARTHTHTHARTRTRTRTHAHTHVHTRARVTHIHTHTHTHAHARTHTGTQVTRNPREWCNGGVYVEKFTVGWVPLQGVTPCSLLHRTCCRDLNEAILISPFNASDEQAFPTSSFFFLTKV